MSRYMTDYEVCLQFCVPPCPACGKIIRDNDKAVQCYKKCKRWFHKHCINLRFSVYMRFEDKIKLRWSCERDDCKGASDTEEEQDEWPEGHGVELLIPSKDHVLVLPENTQYPKFPGTYTNDQELSTRAWKDEISKLLKKQQATNDKEIIKSKEVGNSVVASEIVNTLNKRAKGTSKIKRRKIKESTLHVDSIKNLFSRPDNQKPSPDEGEETIEATKQITGDANKTPVKRESVSRVEKDKLRYEDKKLSLEQMDNMTVKTVIKKRSSPERAEYVRYDKQKKHSLEQVSRVKTIKTKRSYADRTEYGKKGKMYTPQLSSNFIPKPIIKKSTLTEYKNSQYSNIVDLEERECMNTDYNKEKLGDMESRISISSKKRSIFPNRAQYDDKNRNTNVPSERIETKPQITKKNKLDDLEEMEYDLMNDKETVLEQIYSLELADSKDTAMFNEQKNEEGKQHDKESTVFLEQPDSTKINSA